MVAFFTSIFQLIIAGLVIFAVLRIRKNLHAKKRSRYMLITFFIILGIVLIASSATVIYSTKNLPRDYKNKISAKIIIPPFNILDTPISSVYKDELIDNPKKSGAMLIKSGKVAFLHRIALVRMARYSVELQTYIYENDVTSRILMHELKMAADRGVKVRIIVDDNGLSSDTSDIMLLNYHPNIQVKIFNPYEYRSKILKYPQFLFNISRLNYRMHNKLFIVDGSAVIIGGRNVASNYFDDSAEMNFSDTDVLFIGKLAQDALGSFEEYFSYHKSIPVDVFPNHNNPKELEDLVNNIVEINYERFQFDKLRDGKELHAYIESKLKGQTGKGYLLLDEVQEIDNWPKVINSIRVSFDVDIYVTGSNSRVFAGEQLTYISGRYIEIKVYPLSFSEFMLFRGYDNAHKQKALQEYMRIGSFPAVALTNQSALANAVIAGLFDSIFSRDILLRFGALCEQFNRRWSALSVVLGRCGRHSLSCARRGLSHNTPASY